LAGSAMDNSDKKSHSGFREDRSFVGVQLIKNRLENFPLFIDSESKFRVIIRSFSLDFPAFQKSPLPGDNLTPAPTGTHGAWSNRGVGQPARARLRFGFSIAFIPNTGAAGRDKVPLPQPV